MCIRTYICRLLIFFFFKQKTAYEMRISDWSSDVCSSDLLKIRLHLVIPTVENAIAGNAFRPGDVLRSRKGLTVENTNTDAEGRQIGRASCRERVCQYV